MKTRRLTLDAVLSAMCAALGAFALDFGSIKISLESLPVIVAAVLFGPTDGLLTGLIGTLIYQVLRYGITVTTLVWMLPYMIGGLCLGFYAKHCSYCLNGTRLTISLILTELLITVLNTGALFADSMVYGYYYPALITAMLIPRILLSVAKAVVFAILIPLLLKPLRKTLGVPDK